MLWLHGLNCAPGAFSLLSELCSLHIDIPPSIWCSTASSSLALHHAVRCGRIINDECRQRRDKTNTIWCGLFDWDCLMTIYSFALPPFFSYLHHHLFSVVVLYTQGVESKQWREVRDLSRPSVNTTQSTFLLTTIARSLFTTSHLLAHSLGKCCECQSFPIDWPCEYPCAGQQCVRCEWLAD